MSYFSGITDPELIEEGWSPDQIAELRRAEKGVEAKRKIAAENRLQEDLGALNGKGRKIYYELTTGPIPWPASIAASAARASQDPPKHEPKFIYAPMTTRKWWQFWKP